MKKPQIVIAVVVIAVILGLIAFAQSKPATVVDKNQTDSISSETSKEEPKGVVKINESVVVNEYENRKVVIIDDGKMEVELPKEAVITSNTPQSLFQVFFYGKTHIHESGLFDIGMSFNRFNTEKIESFKKDDFALVQIANQEAVKYKEYKANPEGSPANISIEYYFSKSPFSMNCVAYGEDMNKLISICENIFENKITFNNN